MISGKCLCGKIEYTAEELPGLVFNCHCSRCQKAHGSAYSTQVICSGGSLKITKGSESLSEYASPTAIRSFCKECGSRLMNYDTKNTNYLSVSLTTINQKEDFKPIGECYVGQKLAHTRLNEDIGHFEKLPEI